MDPPVTTAALGGGACPLLCPEGFPHPKVCKYGADQRSSIRASRATRIQMMLSNACPPTVTALLPTQSHYTNGISAEYWAHLNLKKGAFARALNIKGTVIS